MVSWLVVCSLSLVSKCWLKSWAFDGSNAKSPLDSWFVAADLYANRGAKSPLDSWFVAGYLLGCQVPIWLLIRGWLPLGLPSANPDSWFVAGYLLGCQVPIWLLIRGWFPVGLTHVRIATFGGYVQTWLILPVVICLSQRLSHACLSISFYTAKLRMAH